MARMSVAMVAAVLRLTASLSVLADWRQRFMVTVTAEELASEFITVKVTVCNKNKCATLLECVNRDVALTPTLLVSLARTAPSQGTGGHVQVHSAVVHCRCHQVPVVRPQDSQGRACWQSHARGGLEWL